jgi:hypothetical protein
LPPPRSTPGVADGDRLIGEPHLFYVAAEAVDAVRRAGAVVPNFELAAGKLRDRVVGTIAAEDRDVRAGTSVIEVVAGPAGELVIAAIGVEVIVARAAERGVRTAGTREEVGIVRAGEDAANKWVKKSPSAKRSTSTPSTMSVPSGEPLRRSRI